MTWEAAPIGIGMTSEATPIGTGMNWEEAQQFDVDSVLDIRQTQASCQSFNICRNKKQKSPRRLRERGLVYTVTRNCCNTFIGRLSASWMSRRLRVIVESSFLSNDSRSMYA